MSTLTFQGYRIPKVEVARAILSWMCVVVPYACGWAATFVLGMFVALTAKRQTTHPQGKKLTAYHKPAYILAGSSGEWEYWNSPWKWLTWWNNYEDGTLGEPSGKHSARVNGNERSVWSQYKWTVRNPFNYAKRTIPLFYCPVDDCDIAYWGDRDVSDKQGGESGWHFIKATHRSTGRQYYYFRSVKVVDAEHVRQAAIGFKLKPTHALSEQDADDKDKAFTIRLPFKTRIN